jgi:hypothetical protein
LNPGESLRRRLTSRTNGSARLSFGLGLLLGTRAFPAPERTVGDSAHFEGQQPFSAGRLVERDFELVRVRLVREMLVRGRQGKRQNIAGDRRKLGLRRELRCDRRQLQRRDKSRP